MRRLPPPPTPSPLPPRPRQIRTIQSQSFRLFRRLLYLIIFSNLRLVFPRFELLRQTIECTNQRTHIFINFQ